MTVETQWLGTLNSDFIQCRMIGHNWTVGGGASHSVGRGLMGRVLRCDRCAMERLDLFDSKTWERVGNAKYVRPNGYDKPKGYERVQRPELTAEAFKRLEVKSAMDAPRELVEMAQRL